MSRHDSLVAKARAALDAIYNDTSVPPSKTRDSIEMLIEEIQDKLKALPKDEDVE